MAAFCDQRLDVKFVILFFFFIDLTSGQQWSEGCTCDFKHHLCDLTTSCEHGVWTTARKFDSMADTIKYGFCDCGTGWSGNLCEYPSAEYEIPKTACALNNGQWNGDFCRCSEDTFGRYCQFRLISMQERNQKCTCAHQRSQLNHEKYLCENVTTSQQPDFTDKIRVLANAQPVIIQPQEANDQVASSSLATNQPSTFHVPSTARPTSAERSEERGEHYEFVTESHINAWIPICITLVIIALIFCITFIVKVKFCEKRSNPRPTISDPIAVTPTQLTTAIATTTVIPAKESPPPSYESLEMR